MCMRIPDPHCWNCENARSKISGSGRMLWQPDPKNKECSSCKRNINWTENWKYRKTLKERKIQ